MKRSLATVVALLVAGSVLAPAAFAAGPAAAEAVDPEPVESCTVIDESGTYELTGDVGHDAAETCIEIRADDVVLDGNGHAVEGPGPGAGDAADAYRGIYVNFSDGVVIRNVEVAGWSPGIRTEGADVTLEDSVVRDGDVGVFLEETGPTTLTNVTVADNEGVGVDTHRTGNLQATDVTLDGNAVGLSTWDAHGLHLEDSRVVNNDGSGVDLHHHSSLTLTDVTVRGNGGDGVEAIAHEGFQVFLTMDGGTVADNGGHGVAAIASAHADLDGVALSGNEGLELHGSQVADSTGRNVTASDLEVGPSATIAFEGERLDLEPVDRESLPDLPDDESAAGDGLNVSGAVAGPVDLTLDSDADTVDLRRHDGDGWATVAEDLDASDGTVEASVDDDGTYALVAADEADGSDGSDDADGSDDSDASNDTGSDDGADTDDGNTGGTGADADPDSEDAGTQTPSDQEKSNPTPTETATDGDGTDADGSSSGSADSTSGSSTDGSTADDPTATDDGTATASPTATGASTATADSDQQQAEDGTDASTVADEDVSADEGEGEATSSGDGPGFGAVVAVLALLASASLAYRRH